MPTELTEFEAMTARWPAGMTFEAAWGAGKVEMLPPEGPLLHEDAPDARFLIGRERAALMAELEACESRAFELREATTEGEGHDADQERLIAEEADAFDARADEIVLTLTGCRRALSSRDAVSAI